MPAEPWTYWIALNTVDGIGSRSFHQILTAFGSPQAAFSATEKDLVTMAGITPKTAREILRFNDWDWVKRELAACMHKEIAIVTCRDPDYPPYLAHIADPPPFLYVRGDLRGADVPLAVVGSRSASAYGRFTTERLSRELALQGVTIVSGLARGIDTAAHQGALAGRGRTVAVLGCGLDVIYPPENADLYERIIRQGAVISEFPLGTSPHGKNFPARNRIISGMSLGVLVVEATEKSGSLITARMAADQGRDVFAVPGSIDAEGSRGTHKLIREGAKLVSCVGDILEELRPMIPLAATGQLPAAEPSATSCTPPAGGPADRSPQPDRNPPPGDREQTLLHWLSDTPVHVDQLIRLSGWPPQDILNVLLQLELQGRIAQMPGQHYLLRK